MTPTDHELKQCPCGKIPERLDIISEHNRPKWAYASPECCGEWMIEFRNQYDDVTSKESYRKAVVAWNETTRGGLVNAE